MTCTNNRWGGLFLKQVVIEYGYSEKRGGSEIPKTYAILQPHQHEGESKTTMKNIRIREEAKNRNVPLWRIAEANGMADYAFSRKLRHELPKDEQEKIIRSIQTLAEQEE